MQQLQSRLHPKGAAADVAGAAAAGAAGGVIVRCLGRWHVQRGRRRDCRHLHCLMTGQQRLLSQCWECSARSHHLQEQQQQQRGKLALLATSVPCTRGYHWVTDSDRWEQRAALDACTRAGCGVVYAKRRYYDSVAHFAVYMACCTCLLAPLVCLKALQRLAGSLKCARGGAAAAVEQKHSVEVSCWWQH
jgi:hypothetical protein